MSHRIYVPVPVDGMSDPDHLVRGCTDCQWCHIDETRDRAIYIDGACSGNGTPNARAGIGAFFYSGSPLNVSSPLTNGPQTNQRAEICAAIAALEIVQELFLNGEFRRVRGVVLISDSAYLVTAVSDWIHKWNKNGWINASGKPVVNRDDFLKLEHLIRDLEKHHVRVRFWLVNRKYNVFGDRLAKAAIGL